jgi:hypothetical protein
MESTPNLSAEALDMVVKTRSYRQVCRKGTDWLLNLMNSDGSIGPAEMRLFYYRVPWAFVLMGELEAAGQVLDWITKHMFTEEGAFEGVSPQGVFDERYGSYPLACLLVGASMLQRFDIVYPGTQFLLSWQDSETGGFCNRRQENPRTSEQELFPTCQGGMTLLVMGELEAAIKAGEWLKRLWELQPDVEQKMYAIFCSEQGLVTQYAPDEAALYVTRKDQPWQHHYNGGIAAAFLSELFAATAETTWLDLARKYQDFSMTTDDCQFQSMQVCKSGWGSGLLYRETRGIHYRDWTVRLGEWFASNQLEDGHWENTKFLVPDPTIADKIEITAEFVMHVANIRSNLAV